MSESSMAIEIIRLQQQMQALTALVGAVLPALASSERPQVIARFREYCAATEGSAFREDLPGIQTDSLQEVLQALYVTASQALGAPQGG